ncbi:MAG TPA: phosphotransferase, partial [Candidatus Limnocylindrales bacterium]|nr:phosphotransferase [Candidatus Limnocylindrales bacterium]
AEPKPEIVEAVGAYLDVASLLGTRTAQLHNALATARDDVSFVPEPFSALSQRSVFQTMRNNAKATIALLNEVRDELPEPAQQLAERAAELGPTILQRMSDITRDKIAASRIRVHGDFHAGQILWTGRDFVFIDFEGEPGRPLSERRHKRSAMVDVAGMLRSFHYAAFGTLLSPRVGGTVRAEDLPQLEPWANLWYLSVASAFLRAYLNEADGQPFVPTDRKELVHLLEASALQKVLYELSYELNNRPDWVTIPLRGLVDLIGEARTSG